MQASEIYERIKSKFEDAIVEFKADAIVVMTIFSFSNLLSKSPILPFP
ncbi:hypothetical protein JGI22_00351 [Candidatus Kryptobacter tengchongensis]|nr:hypothetical protein JGI22_00351 [Candidatus Kryptobacter tengchongensis]